MATRTTKTNTSVTTSDWIPVDWRQHPIEIGLSVVVTGTNTSKVEVTRDDVFDPDVTPTAQDHATLTAISASANGDQLTPVRAVRLNTTAFTSGTATLQVLQG